MYYYNRKIMELTNDELIKLANQKIDAYIDYIENYTQYKNAAKRNNRIKEARIELENRKTFEQELIK